MQERQPAVLARETIQKIALPLRAFRFHISSYKYTNTNYGTKVSANDFNTCSISRNFLGLVRQGVFMNLPR